MTDTKREKELLKELERLRGRVAELEVACKNAKTGLYESEVLYRHLFENLNDAAFVADVETGLVVETNKRAAELLGRPREEIIGMHQSEIHPPDKGREYKDRFRTHTEKGRMADYDGEVLRKDGTIVPVHISAAPVNVGGRKLIIGLFSDASERKRAEEAMRESKEFAEKLISSMTDGVSVLDRNGIHMNVNDAFCQMTGYTREEIMATRRPYPYWPEEELPNIQEAFESALKGGHRDYELVFCRKNGERFPVIVSPSCVRDEDGNVISHFASIKDITGRKKMERELQRAENMESIGILAGGIAHDFNNLLGAILGNISFARYLADPGGKIHKRLEEAERATLKAKDLTQQLLTFSTGGAPVKKAVSISELVRESASFALRGSNVRCDFDIPADLRPVEADPGQLTQVMNNLVINADQAMPDGGVLKVRAANVSIGAEQSVPVKDGQYVRLTIEDQGIGIPGEYLAKIFDPYFTSKKKGSGLGLTTAYSIIKNHGGHITVQSVPGAGTTFSVYLPSLAREAESAPTKPLEAEFSHGSARVLVMDDEEMILNLLDEVLTHAGHEVECSKDGSEALQKYKMAMDSGHPFDAVIMDLTIPGGMGGQEAVIKLLEIDPGARAIVSSGYSNDPVMSEFREYGFKGIVTKPYKVAELCETLSAIINDTGEKD